MGLAAIASPLAVVLDPHCAPASYATPRTDLRRELATEERHVDV